jgi:hypothetical protein
LKCLTIPINETSVKAQNAKPANISAQNKMTNPKNASPQSSPHPRIGHVRIDIEETSALGTSVQGETSTWPFGSSKHRESHLSGVEDELFVGRAVPPVPACG